MNRTSEMLVRAAIEVLRLNAYIRTARFWEEVVDGPSRTEDCRWLFEKWRFSGEVNFGKRRLFAKNTEWGELPTVIQALRIGPKRPFMYIYTDMTYEWVTPECYSVQDTYKVQILQALEGDPLLTWSQLKQKLAIND